MIKRLYNFNFFLSKLQLKVISNSGYGPCLMMVEGCENCLLPSHLTVIDYKSESQERKITKVQAPLMICPGKAQGPGCNFLA